MTPYYEADGISILHGDNLEVMGRLNERFDLVFTSPPYNLAGSPWPPLGNWGAGRETTRTTTRWRNGSGGAHGLDYDEHDDAMPWPEYVAWQQATITAMWDCLTDRGAIFYNHKPRVVGGRLWHPTELLPAEVTLRQVIVWGRAGGMNFNATAFLPTHEWIMLIARPDFRLASRSASKVGDVWYVPQDTNTTRATEHPAPFPVELPARAIEACAPSNILDPYVGSGSTLVAAKKAGLRAVGIEKSERYCEMAAERLDATPLSLFADPPQQGSLL